MKISKEQIRGCWFTELGQRVEGWIPAGHYDPNGREQIDGVDVVALLPDRGHMWYAPASIVDHLLTAPQ